MDWQPIETAPYEGRFLVWNGEVVGVARRGRSRHFLVWDDSHPYGVEGATHWMPLPDPPEDDY